MLSQKRGHSSLEFERQEKKFKSKMNLPIESKRNPTADLFPLWFVLDQTFLCFQDEELSANDFWLQYPSLMKQPLPLFKFKIYTYVVYQERKEDILFLPVNHEQPLTLKRRPSSIPYHPFALLPGTLAEQAQALKEQLQGWFQVTSWSALEEGFESHCPWDAACSMWVQINPQVIDLMVASLALRSPSYSHFQWRWVQTGHTKENVLKQGLLSSVLSFEEMTLKKADCLCLMPWNGYKTPLYCAPSSMLPVGFIKRPVLKLKDRKIGFFDYGLNQPSGLTVYQDKLYVTDSGNHKIRVYNLEGELLDTWGQQGGDDGEFERPFDIAIYKDLVYVADRRNYRIQVLTLEGKYVTKWGNKGQSERQFDAPYSIAVGDSMVFVAESYNNRIQVLDLQGTFLRSWDINKPNALAYQEGLLYVTNCQLNSIQVFTPKGSLVRQWGEKCAVRYEEGNFEALEFLTIHQNKVLVTDKHRISMFDLEGNFQEQWVTGLDIPTGIAVAQNKIYVADWDQGDIDILE